MIAKTFRLPKALFLIALSTLILMSGYEIIKQLIHPEIGIWESHIVTIIFSALVSTLVAYFALIKYEKINRRLNDEIIEHKRLEEEREKLIMELQRAIDNVKTLSGFLPICASCKKIRDDQGYWNQIESYLHEHTDIDFTHSICPDCAKKLYPQFIGHTGRRSD
jgi:hypothetical protein